jgi:hypothetical protein
MYVEVAVEVLMSMVKADCWPSISSDGTSVNIDFHFQNGSALLLPAPLLDQHIEDFDFDKEHPKYQQYEQATEIHNRTELDKDVQPMKILLPFPCDTKGFIDSLSTKPVCNGVILGKFTGVPDQDAKNPLADTHAQTKFLILGLEAAQKPLFVKQETKSKDFTKAKSPPGFTWARAAYGSQESSSSSEEEDKKDGDDDGNGGNHMIDDNF